MKLRLAVAASLMVASMASMGATLPGAGITGTAHDWSSAVTATSSGQSGGTSVAAYFKTDATGINNLGLATAAQITAGQFYTPDSGVTKFAIYNVKAGTAGYVLATKVDALGVPIPDTTYAAGAAPVTFKVQIGQCTKCHTPHQGKTGNLLWNHTLSGNTYQWDDPKTTSGTTYATFKGDTYKGPSPKCLSCHDGTISSSDGVWFGKGFLTAGAVATSGFTQSSHDVTKGGLPSQNLTGTHPVAMPYPLGGVANQYNSSTTGADISAITTEWVADPKTTNGIRLFKDDGTGNITAGTSPGKTGIECTSCHDVHNGTRVKDSYLVTGLLTGSARTPGGYICTQCHLK